MSGSKQLVDQYVRITERIKEQRALLKELKLEEKEIIKEIQAYLNQSEENGIRIDDHTVITLVNTDKCVNKTAKAYKNYLHGLCSDYCADDDANEFVSAILNGKIETTVQQQKLKIMKIK